MSKSIYSKDGKICQNLVQLNNTNRIIQFSKCFDSLKFNRSYSILQWPLRTARYIQISHKNRLLRNYRVTTIIIITYYYAVIHVGGIRFWNVLFIFFDGKRMRFKWSSELVTRLTSNHEYCPIYRENKINNTDEIVMDLSIVYL